MITCYYSWILGHEMSSLLPRYLSRSGLFYVVVIFGIFSKRLGMLFLGLVRGVTRAGFSFYLPLNGARDDIAVSRGRFSFSISHHMAS